MPTPPVVPCLVPSTLDFGAVRPGNNPGGMAGVCNWPRAGQVTAALVNDTSGGLFQGLSLGVYDVEITLPGGGPGQPFNRPVQWQLVQVEIGNGVTPLAVAPGQTVAAGLFFNAPSQADGKTYKAEIQIFSAGVVAATIPVTAVVQAPDFTGAWNLANPYGIEIKSLSTVDPLIGVWNAGHVNDALVLGGQSPSEVLVATNSGGIWLIQQPNSSVSPAARCLTDSWDNTLSMCLAQGPHGPEHIYIGSQGLPFYTGSQGTLAETEDVLGSFRDISPPNAGTIFKIVVTKDVPRRVVVASNGGVFWATIPQTGGQYIWVKVTRQSDGTLFPPGAYSGVALGPNDRVVAAAFGANVPTGLFGLFQGDWSQDGTGAIVLNLTAVPQTNMPPVPPQSLTTFAQNMGRTSLASCASNPSRLYAVASTTDSSAIFAVVASSDGGITWTLVGGSQVLSGQAGGQGSYNNCIAAAPLHADRLLVGWEFGVFQSTNAGGSFSQLNAQGLHEDVHGLYFDPADPSDNTFYVCSDGGLAKTQDGGVTFDTSFNRNLANLECYSAIPRNFWGSLSVRGDFLAVGLQDNSNVYHVLRPTTPGINPWVITGSVDGGWVALVATGQMIATSTTDAVTEAASYTPRSDAPLEFGSGGTVPVRDQNGDDTTGLVAFAVEPILSPVYANMAGQKMYAVARGQRTTEIGPGTGALNVYGAFANGDGSDLHWAQIGSAPSTVAGDAVNAIATLDDGTSVLAGTVKGLIFLIRPLPSGPVTGQQLTISLPPGVTSGRVDRLVFSSATRAFATFNTNGAGLILRFDGTAWGAADNGLPGENLFGIGRDGYGRTWTCTDDKVWVSLDDGGTWKDASVGLPKRPHCSDLRYNFTQQNPPLMYLSTFGRSVWFADAIA
jgi:hypothetical protein